MKRLIILFLSACMLPLVAMDTNKVDADYKEIMGLLDRGIASASRRMNNLHNDKMISTDEETQASNSSDNDESSNNHADTQIAPAVLLSEADCFETASENNFSEAEETLKKLSLNNNNRHEYKADYKSISQSHVAKKDNATSAIRISSAREVDPVVISGNACEDTRDTLLPAAEVQSAIGVNICTPAPSNASMPDEYVSDSSYHSVDSSGEEEVSLVNNGTTKRSPTSAIQNKVTPVEEEVLPHVLSNNNNDISVVQERDKGLQEIEEATDALKKGANNPGNKVAATSGNSAGNRNNNAQARDGVVVIDSDADVIIPQVVPYKQSLISARNAGLAVGGVVALTALTACAYKLYTYLTAKPGDSAELAANKKSLVELYAWAEKACKIKGRPAAGSYERVYYIIAKELTLLQPKTREILTILVEYNKFVLIEEFIRVECADQLKVISGKEQPKNTRDLLRRGLQKDMNALCDAGNKVKKAFIAHWHGLCKKCGFIK